MKFKLVFLFTTFFILNGYGQPIDEINLPKGGSDIKITTTVQLYSLYVTPNQEVYNDNKRLDYFQDISYSIIDQRNKSVESSFPQKLLLYADKKVRYRFIDKIKRYFVSPKWVYYMTDSVEQLKATSFWLSYRGQNLMLEEMMTLEQDIINEKLNKNGPQIMMPPPAAWYHKFEDTMYSKDKKAINEALNEHSYDVLQVSIKKTIKHKNEVIDEFALIELFRSNKVLFLKFDDDILYEDYIHAIQTIKDISKFLDKNENAAYVVEVSFELGEFLEKNSIKLE